MAYGRKSAAALVDVRCTTTLIEAGSSIVSMADLDDFDMWSWRCALMGGCKIAALMQAVQEVLG